MSAFYFKCEIFNLYLDFHKSTKNKSEISTFNICMINILKKTIQKFVIVLLNFVENDNQICSNFK